MDWKTRALNQCESMSRFTRFVIQHFIQDDCSYVASALAFTSLLAIVPLMSVGLSVFSSFPIFQDMADPVQNFIFENFVPATGKIVQTYLQQFASQVSKVSIWGLAFLIITSVLLMYTIERAMNKIWRVNSGRYGLSAFLLYWSILSLAPIMLGLSLAASSYIFSMPLMNQSPSLLLHWLPFLLSLIGFSFLYSIVPNCPVKMRHAFWGGLCAAVLFEVAKNGFAYYLTNYHAYELLYGTFATVPIFFIWVYWVWFITLLGAEISYALSVHHQRRSGPELDGFSHALLWLEQLWQAQQTGKGMTLQELINTSHQPFAVDVGVMLHQLIEAELIHTTAEGNYMLSRDLNQVTLYSLSQLLPYRLPTNTELQYSDSSIAKHWKTVLVQSDAALQCSLDLSLEYLFKGTDRVTSSMEEVL